MRSEVPTGDGTRTDSPALDSPAPESPVLLVVAGPPPSHGAAPAAVEIAERRLHPAYLVISFGRSVRALLPVIAVGIWRAPGWAIALVALLIGLRSVAEWWMRTYRVSDGHLRVRAGLFKRTQDTISIHRITSLDAERGVVQRLLGVWGLKVRTPGNDHRSTIRLHCLSHTALDQLRTALTDEGPSSTPAAPSRNQQESGRFDPASEGVAGGVGNARVAGPETLAVLDTRTLLLAAVTGTSVPLILAGAAATFARARDLLPDRTFRRLAHEVFVGGATTVGLLIGGALLAVFAGIALTSLRLARFTLVRDGDRLRISRGLIAQRSGTIPVDRVQAIRVVEGWWRRSLGYCALEVEVAGISSSNDTERMLFPMIKTELVSALVAKALPELGWQPGPLTPVPASARRRYFTLPVLVSIPVTVGLSFLPGWAGYLAVTPIPLALLIGWGQSVDAGWMLTPTLVTFRWRRVLATHTVVARRQRVQFTEVSRTPWQVRAGLAGIHLFLSSRRKARIRHLAVEDAELLMRTVGRRPRQPSRDRFGTAGRAVVRKGPLGL